MGPVLTLAAYIIRTDSMRPVRKPVFHSLNKPYRAVKLDTIASDLQKAIYFKMYIVWVAAAITKTTPK